MVDGGHLDSFGNILDSMLTDLAAADDAVVWYGMNMTAILDLPHDQRNTIIRAVAARDADFAARVSLPEYEEPQSSNQNSRLRTIGDHLRERIKHDFESLKARILSDTNPFRPLQENKRWTYSLVRELTPEQKLELGNLVFDRAVVNWPGRETNGFVATISGFGLGLSQDRWNYVPKPRQEEPDRSLHNRNAPPREQIIRDHTGRRVGSVLPKGTVLIVDGRRTVIK